MLQKWLFSGELQDPFSEFFVAVNPQLAHLEYLRPSLGGNASLTGDGGFGGLAGEDANSNNDSLESGMRLWEGKYDFKKEMLPRFVGETFGKKVGVVLQPLVTPIYYPGFRYSLLERVSTSSGTVVMTAIG